MSSKLNLDLYKQKNGVKSPQMYEFQTEMFPSKLPEGIYSPSVLSNNSTPRYSAIDTMTINLES